MTAGPGGVGGPSGPPPSRPTPGAPQTPAADPARPTAAPAAGTAQTPAAPAAGASAGGALASAFGAVLAAAAGRIAAAGGSAPPAPGAPTMVPGPDGSLIPAPNTAAAPAPNAGAGGAPAPAPNAAPGAPAPGAPGETPASRVAPMAGADAPARAALAAYGALPFLAARGRGIGGQASLRGAELLARLSGADRAPPAAAPAQPPPPMAPPGQLPPNQPLPPYVPLIGPAAAPVDPSRPIPARAAPQDDDEDVPPARGLREIGLLRHFPTDWNAEGRLQGRTDVPLSDASRAALRALRLPARWRDLPVLCSPLLRARETAAILGDAASVIYDDRLVEMDFGDWEGAIAADLLADPDCAYGPVEGWGWDFRPPLGETPAEMLARVAPVLEEAAAIGPCLIICHRGVMRAIMAAAADWPYLGPEPFRIRRARVHPVMLSAAGSPVALGAPEKLEPRP